MSCMKCGRDTQEGQVFCTSCLEVMAKYPVKPGIAIQLPGRKNAPAPKKAHTKRKQSITPEEQIQKLKKQLKRMILLWLVTLLLLAAAVYPTVEYLRGERFLLPGQNYNTITNTESTTP